MKRASLPPLDTPVYPAPPVLSYHELTFVVSMDGCDIYRKGKPKYIRPATWPKIFVVHYRRSKRAYAEYRTTDRRWVVSGLLSPSSRSMPSHARPKEISQRVETYLDALAQLES